MIVPVLWCSHHDDILARGYYDCGMFEAILARDVWTPNDPITFEHYEVRDAFPDVEGALVVLPARHHTSDADLLWFGHELARLKWSVVLLAGDEEWDFPWETIGQTESRRVWIMQPRPEHIEAGLQGFPGGWYPGTHEGVRGSRPWERDRPNPWFFAGQVTHERRQQCADVLNALPHMWQVRTSPDEGVLHETSGYLRGMPQADYWAIMAASKVIPCPSGPMTVDTARAFEALEAGCVPVVDMVTPRGEDHDYWALLFGDHDLPTIRDWTDFPEILGGLLTDWPREANRCSAMWQQAKRQWAKQLDTDLRAVAREPADLTEPNNAITVVMPTSPTPGDPSTANIATTIESIRAHLPTAEIVIVCDGVRPEQEHQRADYEEYVRRLLWRCNFEWHNVVPVVMDEWGHQANAVRAGLELVDTPFLLFCEHDTPLVEHEIPWEGILACIPDAAKLIRFHHEKIMLDDHRSVMLDQRPVIGFGVPLIRTAAFWARPHVTTTEYYRNMLADYFPPDCRTMIEDRIYSDVFCAWKDHGPEGWQEWGLAIYAPLEPHMQRSTHLDSRGEQPKWAMDYGQVDA